MVNFDKGLKLIEKDSSVSKSLVLRVDEVTLSQITVKYLILKVLRSLKVKLFEFFELFLKTLMPSIEDFYY